MVKMPTALTDLSAFSRCGRRPFARLLLYLRGFCSGNGFFCRGKEKVKWMMRKPDSQQHHLTVQCHVTEGGAPRLCPHESETR